MDIALVLNRPVSNSNFSFICVQEAFKFNLYSHMTMNICLVADSVVEG